MDQAQVGGADGTDADENGSVPPGEEAAGPAVPPLATRKPYVHENHGDRRKDAYYWLRDRESSEVLDYLKAENAYTGARTAHTATLRQELYDEILGRIQEDDSSVPSRLGDWWYYSRTEEGKAYAIHCRKHESLEAEEEVILDENELAEGHGYFSLGALKLSPDHRTAAYAVDTDGSEDYTLRFRDLATGDDSPEAITGTAYSVVWANDNRTVFYTVRDEATRPYRCVRHTVGDDPAKDAVVMEELDERFWMGLTKTRSERFILVELGSKITDEVHFLDADDPAGEFRMVRARTQGIEYSVTHHGESFYIVTNEDAVTFKMMIAPVATPGPEHWEELIGERDDVTLQGVDAFRDHLVIYERSEGLPQLRIRQLSTGDEHRIEFPEPTYSVWSGENPEFNTSTLRIVYESMVTPSSVFDYDMVGRGRTLKKRSPIKGGYEADHYETRRLWATAPDGVKVPLSIVARKGVLDHGPVPLMLYGYGSYGSNSEPGFRSSRLSLLDRGMAFVIAHVRGGSEMGRRWYEDGKFLHKSHTFEDFIACAEHLVDEGFTRPDRLAIRGGSAGGLLMGAVMNLRPDLFRCVVAHVPFVDVVTTMLDESIPLTVVEYEEWGNPNELEFYQAMKSYSPYDNVREQDYPHTLVTAGLNDPRVQYWEPAKWTARLRARKTDDNDLLLKTHMGAGHGGASGRYGQIEELAFEFGFVLDKLGLAGEADAGGGSATR